MRRLTRRISRRDTLWNMTCVRAYRSASAGLACQRSQQKHQRADGGDDRICFHDNLRSMVVRRHARTGGRCIDAPQGGSEAPHSPRSLRPMLLPVRSRGGPDDPAPRRRQDEIGGVCAGRVPTLSIVPRMAARAGRHALSLAGRTSGRRGLCWRGGNWNSFRCSRGGGPSGRDSPTWVALRFQARPPISANLLPRKPRNGPRWSSCRAPSRIDSAETAREAGRKGAE